MSFVRYRARNHRAQGLPRNIEFLYSKNRLNVAISRSRCTAIVIANPALMAIQCQTPEQMTLGICCAGWRRWGGHLEAHDVSLVGEARWPDLRSNEQWPGLRR